MTTKTNAQFNISRNAIVAELWNEKLPAGYELYGCEDPALEYAVMENKAGDSYNWELFVGDDGIVTLYEYVYVGDGEDLDNREFNSLTAAITWIKQRIGKLYETI